MASIASTHCDLHRERPAAARCPSCEKFFCAECITEHDGKLSCAACLEARSEGRASAGGEASGRGRVAVVIQCLLGLVLCWGIYYALARLLMAIPADFHDGTLWEE